MTIAHVHYCVNICFELYSRISVPVIRQTPFGNGFYWRWIVIVIGFSAMGGLGQQRATVKCSISGRSGLLPRQPDPVTVSVVYSIPSSLGIGWGRGSCLGDHYYGYDEYQVWAALFVLQFHRPNSSFLPSSHHFQSCEIEETGGLTIYIYI